MNFIDRFIEWTSYGEGPEAYFRWAAISAIGAVMRDNCYHEWGYNQKLYPNLFVLIVGPPGIGKQLPMRMAGNLIRSVGNTTVIAGSASMPAVIQTLGTRETGQARGASCILYAEELASFYVKDQNTNEILTDLSDFHENWDRKLISWSANLKNVCMSLFAGSNAHLLKTVFDASAIYGGLLSRTLMVVANEKRHKSAMSSKTVQLNPQHEEILKNHLRCISKLKGSILLTPRAEEEFVNWYSHWDESNDPSGVKARVKTHIKKAAMCIAMADESFKLEVSKRHMEEAIELCLGLQKNYRILTMESGKSPTAQPNAVILRAIREAKNHRITERVLLRNHFGELNLKILEECIPSLERAQLIVSQICDNETTYCMTPLGLELYKDS